MALIYAINKINAVRLDIVHVLISGRYIGCITRLARPSVCPSVPYRLVTRKQKKT